MTATTDNPQCIRCGEEYPTERLLLGFRTCLKCGEEEARKKVHTVVPMHKSNLVVIGPNELELLKGISNRGGQISGGGQNSDSPTEPAGRNIQEECRSPYCECPEDQCKHGKKDMREDQARKDFGVCRMPPTKSMSKPKSGSGTETETETEFKPRRVVRVYPRFEQGQLQLSRKPWYKRSEPETK